MKRFAAILTLLICLALPCALPRAAAEEGDERIVTALMYHSVLASRQGEYIVSPARLEEDIKNFLKNYVISMV